MHRSKGYFCGLVVCLFLVFGFAATVLSPVNADRGDGVTKMQGPGRSIDWSSLPLSFTQNQGQFGEKTRFRCDAPGATFYLAADEVVYLITRRTDEPADGEFDSPRYSIVEYAEPRLGQEGLLIKAQFIGANSSPVVAGVDRLSQVNNYFLGNDPSRWKTNVANFACVVYREIYPGIDLKYYGDGRSVKYDFVLRPGADVSTIKIRYEGVEGMQVTPGGDLEIETAFGPIRERAPLIYQQIAGERRRIAGRYEIKEPGVFGFDVDQPFSPAHPLVIDPELVYSTYLGGASEENAFGVAVDEQGSAYVVGWTYSGDFPTANPYDETHNGSRDIFVTKLSPSGDSLLYSTYIGGSGPDEGLGIAVDSEGNAYINGQTWSSDFPTVVPYDDSFNGNRDVIVAKLSSSGDSLIYSTFLGGGALDLGWRITVDHEGCAYVVGATQSSDFPTENPYDASLDGYEDAFVAKLSSSGRILEYSTYLGGTENVHGYGIAVDAQGSACVAGFTLSTDFPMVNAHDDTHNGSGDAFVAKLSAPGNSLLFSTYLGGSNWDDGSPIAVDGEGNVYVAGRTSSPGFPAVNGYDPDHNGERDSYVAKFSSNGDSLVYSTFLGGSDDDYVLGLAVDACGNAYVCGHTNSPDFLIAGDGSNIHQGGYDAFVLELACSGRMLVGNTYLGGASFEEGWAVFPTSDHNVYVTGATGSSDFPVTPEAFDLSYNGDGDVFVARVTLSDRLAGDANGDDLVDVGDLVYLISYLFREGAAPDPLWTSDLNCDGEINLGDTVYLINYLYRNGPPPAC